MSNLAKGYSILSYFAALIGGFFIGLAVAAFTEAGKGQMLAGGAIILFYGLVGGFIALCFAFFIAYKSNKKVIVASSIFYLLAIILTFFYLKHNKQQRDLERQQNQQTFEQIEDESNKVIAILIDSPKKMTSFQQDHTGLGMFIPNFYEKETLYFYGKPTFGKSVQEHMPTNSITFKQSEYGGFEIVSAPPWLVPDHLKLDYDLLYFRVQTVTHEFLEVTVNTTNNQTMFVDRLAGKLLYWPEFFMSVNSVEFPNPENNSIYERPFESAGKMNPVSYSFMRPLKVKNEWMHVEFIGDDYDSIGKGWIRWMKDGKLLITYSLLS